MAEPMNLRFLYSEKSLDIQAHLKDSYFTTVNHQEAVSFMFAQTNRGKIKNAKIPSWRL